MTHSLKCYISLLLTHWILFTILPVLSLNDINILSFGFETASEQFFNTTNTVHVTLWFNFTIYQVTFNSLKLATIYTVSEHSNPSFTVIGSADCDEPQYKMMITNDHKQPVLIEKVFVNMAFGVWYGVSGHCLPRVTYNNVYSDTPCHYDNTYFHTSLCINNGTCGPYAQIISFDVSQPNKYITYGAWEDATNITDMNTIACSCSSQLSMSTVTVTHNVNDQCISSSTLEDNILSWKYWDVLNASFAFTWMLIAIYIVYEVYPFWVDKHLKSSHIAVQVMCILFIISLFNCTACLTVHFVKYGTHKRSVMSVLNALLLLSYNLYFTVYACIFYTWFLVAHSMTPSVVEWLHTAKIVLIWVCAIVTLLSWASYIITLHDNHMDTMGFFSLAGIIAIIWGIVGSLTAAVFVYYAYAVSRVLFTTFITSSRSQRHSAEDRRTAKKVFTINTFITFFFVSQSILTLFYVLHHRRFTIIPLIIDLSLNLLLTVALLITYRKPMHRMVLTETKRTYRIKSWVNKHVLKDRDKNKARSTADASRSNAVGKQSTIDMKHFHAAQMSFTQSTGGCHQQQITQSFQLENIKIDTESRTELNENLPLNDAKERKLRFDYDEIPHLTVYQCLEHSDGYQVFYEHCKKQYCADTVSAATEFIQFQNRYNIEKKHEVKIPPLLPLSEIVQDDTLLMREKIVALCKKYIVAGSEFELNISGTQKTDLMKAMPVLEDLPDDECSCIFNDCVFGIIASLHETFISFQATSFYQELKMNMFKEKRRLKALRQRAKREKRLQQRQLSLTPLSTPEPLASRVISASLPNITVSRHNIAFSRSISPSPTPPPCSVNNTSNTSYPYASVNTSTRLTLPPDDKELPKIQPYVD